MEMPVDYAVCYRCIEDSFLKDIVKSEGTTLRCSVCEEETKRAYSVQQLGEVLEPVMREHFMPGPTVRVFGEDDDSDGWEQDGEPMSSVVQQVLGQYFEFEDEIVEAVCAAENWHPRDGDSPYWDNSQSYVETPVQLAHLYHEWEFALHELKYGRRFFSPSARTLFEWLFEGIDALKVTRKGGTSSVVRNLPAGRRFYRARISNSSEIFKAICSDPFKHVGPPPPELAPAGRMNAEGVVVFYGAKQRDAALAELRPAIGNDTALISVETTRSLRLLDFGRLERARSTTALSFFQPDFERAVERTAFIRRLHRLITLPVVPGRETEYLITQTMAEYLAHVHPTPFNGILFASAQMAKGVNVVLFNDPSLLSDVPGDSFGIKYVDKSLQLFGTTGVSYMHKSIDFSVGDDGRPLIHNWDADDDM